MSANRRVLVWAALSIAAVTGCKRAEDESTGAVSAATGQSLGPSADASTPPGVSYWAPPAGMGDKLYMSVPAIAGNGHAMTWDGRLAIAADYISPVAVPPPAGASTSFQIGSRLAAGQSWTAGNVAVSLGSDCDVTLTVGGVQQFSTQTANLCAGPHLVLQGDGNLVLYGVPTSPADAGVKALWSSTTSGEGVAIELFSTSPYFGVVNDAGLLPWYANRPPTTAGWVAKLFLPEVLGSNPSPNLTTLQTEMQSAFAAPYPWGLPAVIGDAGTNAAQFPPTTQVIPTLPALNTLALVPQPGHEVNPFYSDAAGNPSASTSFMTYALTVYAPNMDPAGAHFLTTFTAQAVVQNPHQPNAQIYSVAATTVPQAMVDTSGHPIAGVEPTATFDGCLIVFNALSTLITSGPQDALKYTYNPNAAANPASGWSVPQPISNMNTDAALRARGYPIALNPIRDAFGNVVGTQTALLGAYPWMSLDGSDVFFSAVVDHDGSNSARRAGTCVLGSGTKGMIRQLDGPPNVNRYGVAPFRRLIMSSLGRTPGQWSPFEFQQARVLPLTDKLYTYPLFSSNSGAYFEASFEETLAGNYDLYLDMAEVVAINPGGKAGLQDYDPLAAQDLSGHFHYGQLNAGGAAFPEEAFPATCTVNACPMGDPLSGTSNLFSGKSVYFNSNGAMTVNAVSATGDVLLGGAQDLTVSLAVLPLADLSHDANNDWRFLANKADTFNLVLEMNRQVSATVVVPVGGALQQCRLTFAGPQLPLGQWTHLAMTFQASSGALQLFENGLLVATQVCPAQAALNVDASPLILGPSLSSPGAGAADAATFTYALDQVGVSRVVRTPQELLRQAGRVFPRLSSAQMPNVLPTGIQPQAVRSPALASRPLQPNVITLGRYLFFDPQLSPDNRVSCASCHLPNSVFTEPVALHASRIQEPGQPAHLLRNTPDLYYLATKELFFREGRAPSLQAQVDTVLANPVEMGRSVTPVLGKLSRSTQYQQLFAAAFPTGGADGGPAISDDNLTAALQEFELSLITTPAAGGSPFDQYMAGNPSALTPQEQQGMALFFGKARCAQCHSGSAFSDGAFHADSFVSQTNADGVLDLGRERTSGGADDAAKFLTPSLRNVSLTGPYFHNGSVQTLTDVVNLYNSVPSGADGGRVEEMLFPINLTGAEVAALVAFLGTLTSNPPALSPPTYQGEPAPAPTSVSIAAGSAPIPTGTLYQLDAVMVAVQVDGNLVVYDSAANPLWSSGTGGMPCGTSCSLVLGSDGNLRLLNTSGQAYWASNTSGSGYQLTLSSTPPYLTLGAPGGSPVWSAFGSTLAGGEMVLRSQGSTATSADFGNGVGLTLQTSGDLVVFSGTGLKAPTTLWHSATAGRCIGAQCEVAFQIDGNLVLYARGDAGAVPYWASNTGGSPSALLRVLNGTPSLEIVSAAQVLWAN